MADNDVIRSPLFPQPSRRSPKLRIYESLFLFNQGVDHVVALLRSMDRFSFADKEELQSAQTQIEEVRCDVNADFAEHLTDSERFDEARFSKLRHNYEKQWRDPDDVYIDVQRREEERRALGLPMRIVGGILPYSAVGKAEEHWEAEQRRKKTCAAKRGKHGSNISDRKRGPRL